MKFELGRCVVRVCGVFVGCRFDVRSMLVRCWLWCDKGELWGGKRAIKKIKVCFLGFYLLFFAWDRFRSFFLEKLKLLL